MMISPRGFTLRLATETDIPAFEKLIAHSVRSLQAADYSSEQIEGALGTVFGVRGILQLAQYCVASEPFASSAEEWGNTSDSEDGQDMLC